MMILFGLLCLLGAVKDDKCSAIVGQWRNCLAKTNSAS